MRYDFISALTTLINEKNWQLLYSFVILYSIYLIYMHIMNCIVFRFHISVINLTKSFDLTRSVS